MLNTIKGSALNETIRDYVKQYILDHNLNPGDPLPPETHLAQQLGVGRSSVREAVKALQSLGIVEVRHGNGLFVRSPNVDPIMETLSHNLLFDPSMFAEVFQIRIWLESAVIEDVVEAISEVDIRRLGDILGTWEVCLKSDTDHTVLDEEFHRTLYQSLNNRTLIKILEVFWHTLKQIDRPSEDKVALWASFREHQAILASVKARNPQQTRQQIIDHFHYAQKWITVKSAYKQSIV